MKCEDCKYCYTLLEFDSCPLVRGCWLNRGKICMKNMKLKFFGFIPCEYYEEYVPKYRISKYLKRKILINKRIKKIQ